MPFKAGPWDGAPIGKGPKDRTPLYLFSCTLALPQNHASWAQRHSGTQHGGWQPAHPTFGSHGAPSSLPHRTSLLQARPRLLLPVQSLVCLAAFGLALPLAISLFPQMSEVSGEGLKGRAGGAVW